jgi:hypothetical protein
LLFIWDFLTGWLGPDELGPAVPVSTDGDGA